MSPKIIGISGSPIPNSNTDRLIIQMLKSSGVDYEFVKLSHINVRPCRACKACVTDNLCKVLDDFQELAPKVKESQALIIGGYTPYEMLDAYTKSFLERLWSMRHVRGLNQGRIVVTVVSSLSSQTAATVLKSMAAEINKEKMNHVAQLGIVGNVPCLTCGSGDNCDFSGVQKKFGPDAKASADLCSAVETQQVWEEASGLAKMIGQYIRGESVILPKVVSENN
ncbi:flavodoxin family protein [Desulfosporosinus sp. PR]|uniref:flavodoxin family protein n=1 Tax=Candidatus Desulfosporosinus nitrosoreducens TaxID=3401928 RepID=UPI0027F53B79|nr:flavodoxin family protein [Desulfosporosinus sp. PR]MDQ7094585.1 flavodoxin family protein [Desulfosporosinus sp. PR]